MRFKVPLSMVVSKAYKDQVTRGGRIVLRKEFRDAKEDLYTKFLSVARENGWKPYRGWVDVSIFVTLRDKRQKDAHNFEEILFDALQGVAYLDDKQVVCHELEMLGWNSEDPNVEILVYPFDGEPVDFNAERKRAKRRK